MTTINDKNRIFYDDQADVFETRAGLSAEVARQVAAAICDFAGLEPGDLIIEIGAGTGEIGQWLARPPYRYVGFDNSRPMLEVFMPRLYGAGGPSGATAGEAEVTVLCADAEGRWPVEDGTAAAIFGSRVLHLLNAEHIFDEAERVSRASTAVLVAGWVQRDPFSPRFIARKKLRDLLVAHGLKPRPSGGRPTQLFAHAEARGAEHLELLGAATWPETVTPIEVIDGWREKTSLGGINPPADVAESVIAALDAWVAETYDQPAMGITTDTQYVLEGIRLKH